MIFSMTDICKDYPMGKSVTKVLKNVTLSVSEGDYIAIMGPSGSGKTTLMNIIGCLDVPTTGSYLFGDKDIKKLRKKQLADLRNRKIGFVFQSFNLLPKLTALDNVALPLLYGGVRRSERRKRAKEALERVGLLDRLNYRPDQLSGGQCQRVAIARALANDPPVILADEPTGNLDTPTSMQIMDLLCELNGKGRTILMVTHEDDIAARATSRIVLRDGRIVSHSGFDETEAMP